MTPCGAAKAAATRKRAKYAEIIQSHIFVPIAIETLGPINQSVIAFLTFPAIEEKPHSYTKRLSVLIKMFNSVAFHDTLLPGTVTEG